MLALPLTGHPLRELFEVSHLAAIGSGEIPVVMKAHALAAGRRTVASDKAIRSVVVIALEGSTDNLVLLRIGKRGGWRKLWTFGPCPRTARLA